jgi:outer membrane protein OmpA-like peptidoglycan-associated protein
MTRYGRLGSTMILGALALGSAGCVATQDWVNKQISQASAQLETKIVQVENGVAQGKTAHEQLSGRVTQLDGRVTNVDARVSQVATQVVETRTVANEGVQKAGAVDQRLTRTLDNRYRRELLSTVTLLFAPGKSALLPVHEDALGGVLKTLLENPTYTADIVGYTDAMGPERYNLTLSWLREEAARRYLTERGQLLNRVAFIGLGEDRTGGDKNNPMARASDRQVAILIYRPVM